FFSSRRRHTRFSRDWSSDVCSSDLTTMPAVASNQNQIFSPALAKPASGWPLPTMPPPLRSHSKSSRLGQLCLRKRIRMITSRIRSEERRVGKEGRYWWEREQGKLGV